MIEIPRKVGATKITAKNQITLPAEALRQLGWERGDELVVWAVGCETVRLTRRPESYADHFLGKMGDVFGDHEEVLRFLDEERRAWEEWENRWEHDR